jgi:protein-S-isoprenylcysteine O-methyltransferase Ste14
LLYIFQIVTAFAAAGPVAFSPGPRDLSHYVGLAIGVPGLVLVLTARQQLGSSFSVSPQARRLVTTGLYSRIRNPIYFFACFAVVGLALAVHQPRFLLIFLVMIPVQVVRARAEAKVLEEKFGDEYRDYRRHTWF